MSANRTKPDPQNNPRSGTGGTGGHAQKKPYRSPKLTAYGSIQDLTSSTSTGSKNDGGGAGMNMMV